MGDISNAIGEYVKKNGFYVVKEFQGHGVGRDLHEDPGVPNYGKAGKGARLEPGITLAIEPMVNVRYKWGRNIRRWVDSDYKRWEFISTLRKYNFNYRKEARNIDNDINLIYTILAVYVEMAYFCWKDIYKIQ